MSRVTYYVPNMSQEHTLWFLGFSTNDRHFKKVKNKKITA